MGTQAYKGSSPFWRPARPERARSRTDEEEATCDRCGLTFVDDEYLAAHVRKVHG